MSLTEYETTIIIRPDIGGDAVETTLDRIRDVIKNRGGKLLAINHWGKRKLAYEIAKHARGVFVHANFLGANTLVQELERNMRISDNVLRFMTIRLAEEVEADSREEKAYERPQYDLDDGSDDASDNNDDEDGHDGHDGRRNRDDFNDESNQGSGSDHAGEED
jgi:small subunit ribosomal protein S6